MANLFPESRGGKREKETDREGETGGEKKETHTGGRGPEGGAKYVDTDIQPTFPEDR